MATDARLPGAASDGERRLTAEHVAARALLKANSIDEAAPKILEAICEALGWECGALWAVDREADVLRCVELWNGGPAPCPEFEALSRRTSFPRGVGLPGRVWASRQPAWIPDVTTDPNFPRAAVAAREGLHGAFGFPVVLRGEVLSVMEFFSRDIREPDSSLLAMLATVGSQIGMFIDRRRAQEELDRFFTLSLDLICVAGFDGYFKRVNPAWRRVLGYSEEELLSRPYLDRVHPDDYEATVAEAKKLNEGQELVYFENRYLHKDGTLRWLLWTAAPFPEQKLIYAAARDITERKAAEQTLAEYARDLEATHRELADQAARLALLVKELEVAKRKAEEATETKSAFLANMSHEIRTPLNAILGMTSLALETRLSPQQTDYLEAVKSSAESLLAVVNDILDFSKIEARRLELDYAPFDLRETVGDAARLLALKAGEKGLELACDVHHALPPALVGDAGRLRQVLINIIGNAIKFTSQGEVVVRVTLERADGERVTLHFAISDTGIGIPADKQTQIFQAFTQADSSTTRRYGGTGLGLAIAQRLVELMGGRLWVESEVDRGSTFHFTAVFDRARTTVARAAEDPRALEGLRVLVVDDNATNRQILEEMLRSWRMRPTVVGDATSAMEALHQASRADQPYQVVVSDYQMPDVDGFTLARSIRRDRHLRRVPIVLLTSVGHTEDAARSRRIGIDAFLTKPVKHSDLLDTLVNVLTGRERLPAAAAPRSAARSGRPERPLRVLVAEDNAVNRKLAVTLLERRGHVVRAVENGREAVEVLAAAPSRIDVVVMDLQMPEMGGLDATRAIRARAPAGRRVPIIALTAHAMQGDRERCLEAGMDDYLPKPIDADQLVAAVERLGGGAPARVAAAARPASDWRTTAATVFDEEAALARTGGDRRLLRQVVALFRSDSRQSLRRIERAVQQRDGTSLQMAAHALKGSIANIGGTRGRDAAAELEDLGRSSRFEGAAAAVARLRDRMAELEAALADAQLVAPARPAAARPPAVRSGAARRPRARAAVARRKRRRP